MKFTGRRLEFCLACGGKLPDGSRIDRKYCRAACIERAYYQRHPDRSGFPAPPLGDWRSHGGRASITGRPSAPSAASGPSSDRATASAHPAHERPTAPALTPRAVEQPTTPGNAQALALLQLELEQLRQHSKQQRTAKTATSRNWSQAVNVTRQSRWSTQPLL